MSSPLASSGEAGVLDQHSELRTNLQRLESEQSDFIAAELQHLRELALLNRASDALTLRRSHAQILEQAAREAAALGGTERLWFIEPDSAGRMTTLRDGAGRTLTDPTVPKEVSDLFERIVRENPATPLTMPTYDPAAPEGMYIGMAAATAEHLMEVLILYYSDLAAAGSSERHRLVQSLLHQTATACENAKLFESIGAMIVDVVLALALAIESRDPYTGGHVQRVTGYALCLAQHQGLDQTSLAKLRLGGVLHDIGKVAVPDAILRKNGKLDPDEFAIMKTHSAVGGQIVSPIPQLAPVAPIIRQHHERWDGKGYPDGLAGPAINPLARIVAVADSFDAMTSDRPYRKGMDFGIARAEIARWSGLQFDPQCVQVLASISDQDLRDAAAQARHWCGHEHAPSPREFLAFMDIDRPRIA